MPKAAGEALDAEEKNGPVSGAVWSSRKLPAEDLPTSVRAQVLAEFDLFVEPCTCEPLAANTTLDLLLVHPLRAAHRSGGPRMALIRLASAGRERPITPAAFT